MNNSFKSELSSNRCNHNPNEKDFTKMCEKPTPLGVGWIAQIMCM